MAERKRFELSIAVKLYTLSRLAPSTTRTPLQRNIKYTVKAYIFNFLDNYYSTRNKHQSYK